MMRQYLTLTWITNLALTTVDAVEEGGRASFPAQGSQGPLIELPVFKEHYMKKNNLTSISPKDPSFLVNSDMCKRMLSKEHEYKAGQSFYHGTLATFSGFPYDVSWFSNSLPPVNILSMHVPMVWACRAPEQVPVGWNGEYYLKEYKLKSDNALPEEVSAHEFYNDVKNQKGEAAHFCTCKEDFVGFELDEDAADQLPEQIFCRPSRDLEYITQYVGKVQYVGNVSRVPVEGNVTVILDVGGKGKYALPCDDQVHGFEVLREPSRQQIASTPAREPSLALSSVTDVNQFMKFENGYAVSGQLPVAVVFIVLCFGVSILASFAVVRYQHGRESARQPLLLEQ